MRWWKKASVGLKVAIIATVVLALSVVGVFAAERLNSSNQDKAAKASETGTSTPKPDVKFRGEPLELGTVAKISSNYRVAVTELSRYEVPSGQILAVTIDATYIGKEDGEPWGDLSVEFVGSGTQTFGEAGCPFDLGEADPVDQPTLKTGDEATYAVCIELPVVDLPRGRVSVQEAFSNSDRIAWSTKEAVTKTLPSAAPSGSGARAPSAPRRPAGQRADASKTCEKYEDDMEEYREGRDDLEDLADRYESKPDHDDEQLEDYEAWLDAMDKNAEWYEKNC